METYKLIIGFNSKQYENYSFEPDTYISFDIIGERTVTTSSQIASQPMQTGDTISDHMFRDPLTYQFNGTFGTDSKNWDDDFYTDGGENNFITTVGDRLTNVQTTFEKIKNDGILCRITFIQCDDEGNSPSINGNYNNRFITRNNMALRRISWVEKLNTVSFTFEFYEIIMVAKQEEYDLSDEEMRKYRLPSLSAPKGSTLGQVLSDTGNINEIVALQLYNDGWISDNFVKEVMDAYDIETNYDDGMLTAGIIAGIGIVVTAISAIALHIAAGAAISAGVFAAGTSMATAMVVTAASSTSIFPVGTIVAGAVAITVGAVALIRRYNERKNREERERQILERGFNSLKRDGKDLENLLLDIENVVTQIDSGLTIYQFNENVDQQVIIKFDNQLFTFTASKPNATDDIWKLEVESQDGKKIRQYSSTPSPIVNLFDLENDSMYRWFSSLSGESTAYLYNPSLNLEFQEQSNGGKGEEALKNVEKYLPGYYILISKGDIKENIKRFKMSIVAALGEKGYAELE